MSRSSAAVAIPSLLALAFLALPATADVLAVHGRTLHTMAGPPIEDGVVEGLEVICPRHGARFCLKSGAALSPPAYEPVRSFPVAEIDGRLCIDLA